MITLATLGATAALLMTSAAFAQTSQSPAPAQDAPPAVVQPTEPGATPGASATPAPDIEMDLPEEFDEAEDSAESREADEPDAAMREERRRGQGERRGRRGRAEHHRGGDDYGGAHDRMHRMMHGMHGMRRDRDGASFRLSHGEGGPSVVIECADRDTTQECVEAIMPLLEMVVPEGHGR
jgi:hypothetical protein